eukprot:1156135-Pelagomonas_calceolata.AAC.1
MIRASNRWGMTLVLCVAVVGVAPEALWGRAASAWANSPPATFSVHTYIGQMHSFCHHFIRFACGPDHQAGNFQHPCTSKYSSSKFKSKHPSYINS